MDVLFADDNLSSLGYIVDFEVVAVRQDQKGGAVILEAEVIDPPAHIFHSEKYFKHRFNVFEGTLILGVILHFRAHDKGIF